MWRMVEKRKQNDVAETAKNAAAGYAVIVLGTICFVLALAVLAMIVRLIVGASAGV